MKKYLLFIFLFVFYLFFSSATTFDSLNKSLYHYYDYFFLNISESINLDVDSINSIEFLEVYNLTNSNFTIYSVSVLIKGSYYLFSNETHDVSNSYFTYFDDIPYLFNFTFVLPSNRFYNEDTIIELETEDRVNYLSSNCELNCYFYPKLNSLIFEKKKNCSKPENRLINKVINDGSHIIFINGYNQNSSLYQYIDSNKRNIQDGSKEDQDIQNFFNYGNSDGFIFVDLSSKEGIQFYNDFTKEFNYNIYIDLEHFNHPKSNILPIILVHIRNKEGHELNKDYLIKDDFVNFESFQKYIEDIYYNRAYTAIRSEIQYPTNISNDYLDNDSTVYDNSKTQVCSTCHYYDSNLGLEKCLDVGELYYFAYDNKSYQIFEAGLPEMETFSRSFNKMILKTKVTKFYENGREDVKISENNYYNKQINISNDDVWDYQVLPSNTKGLLIKDDLKIRFDLNDNNLLKTIGFSGPDEDEIDVKLALIYSNFDSIDNFFNSAVFLIVDLGLNSFEFVELSSKDNDDRYNLEVFKDGSVKFTVEGNVIQFNKQSPLIYQEKLKDGKFLIFLKDYYLGGSESDNYVEVVFVEIVPTSKNGNYHLVKCKDSKIYHKIFSQEELGYLSPEDLRYTNCDKDQCILNQKCYNLGYRKDRKYCSDDRYNFVLQKGEGEFCDNNFECDSNLCVDEKCVGISFLQKILDWFRKLFSTE